jgi:hypothetical protein
VATWPSADEYKAWARVPDADTVDDAAIGQAIDAVNVHVAGKCTMLDPDAEDLPADVVYAVLLLTNRLLARRNSPEGIVGSFDGVIADIGRYDPDAYRLLGPYVVPGIA